MRLFNDVSVVQEVEGSLPEGVTIVGAAEAMEGDEGTLQGETVG
jgi:hypothetical protein